MKGVQFIWYFVIIIQRMAIRIFPISVSSLQPRVSFFCYSFVPECPGSIPCPVESGSQRRKGEREIMKDRIQIIKLNNHIEEKKYWVPTADKCQVKVPGILGITVSIIGTRQST